MAELIRADVSSVDNAAACLRHFFEPDGGSFNYLAANKRVKLAYKGLHQLKPLVEGLPSDVKKVGHKPNMEVVTIAAPVAFGRKTQVFDLSPRRFPYGRDRLAPYRIAFFFTEAGVIKVSGVPAAPFGRIVEV